jgi:hypothetical protein
MRIRFDSHNRARDDEGFTEFHLQSIQLHGLLASSSCLDYSNGSKDVMVILVVMSIGNTSTVGKMFKALSWFSAQ